MELCKSSGVEFPVFDGGQYPKETFNGIPFCVVWDHTGKQIYKGAPDGAKDASKNALQSAPPLYLGDVRIEKLKPLAAQIEKKSALGKAAADLRKKLDSADEAEKAEARTLLDVVENYAKGRTAEIKALEQENPDQALADLKALAKELAGDSLGSEIAAQADKDAADPALKQLRLGLKAVADQTKALDSLPPCKACKVQKGSKHVSLACEACRKANEGALASVRKALEGIVKKYPGSSAERKAQELLGKL